MFATQRTCSNPFFWSSKKEKLLQKVFRSVFFFPLSGEFLPVGLRGQCPARSDSPHVSSLLPPIVPLEEQGFMGMTNGKHRSATSHSQRTAVMF